MFRTKFNVVYTNELFFSFHCKGCWCIGDLDQLNLESGGGSAKMIKYIKIVVLLIDCTFTVINQKAYCNQGQGDCTLAIKLYL